MVEDRKLDRNDVASAAINPAVATLDFGTQVKVPERVRAWSIQNSGNIVLEDYRGEEADIDVASDLEDVFILPAGTRIRPWFLTAGEM